ncbi:hypothetical protein QDF31_000492 [Escherichia coli]|nr:hypothetical protein [Escherichia coli]
MSYHSLDSYYKTLQAPKSVAQARREEFQQKLEAAARHIVEKMPELLIPLMEELAAELQKEMPQDMEGTALQRLRFEASRLLHLPVGAFRK